jgi:hypothetical protein
VERGKGIPKESDGNVLGKWSMILSLKLVSMPHSCPDLPDHCDGITPPTEFESVRGECAILKLRRAVNILFVRSLTKKVRTILDFCVSDCFAAGGLDYFFLFSSSSHTHKHTLTPSFTVDD